MWLWWLGVAHAVEIGSSIGLGGDFYFDDFGARGFGGGFPPSLDFHFDPIVLQIHVLNTLAAALDERVYIGGNLYVQVAQQPVTTSWNAVVQPGASLDLAGNPVTLGLAFETRLGIQAEQQAGFGIYLVPAVGIVTGGGQAEAYVGGGLQMSVWFGAGGSGTD